MMTSGTSGRRAAWIASCAVAVSCSGARPLPPPTASAPATTPSSVRALAASRPAPSASAGAPIDLASPLAEDRDVWEGGRRRHARAGGADGVCEVVDDNVDRDVNAILDAKPPARAAIPASPWDHHSTPRYFDLVNGRFALDARERALLFRQGFVVPARLTHATYSRAFHDVFQSQLPVYVSMDALFYAVFRANDGLIASVEESHIWPELPRILDGLAAGLRASAARYPHDCVQDLDVYLTVARTLFAGQPVKSDFATDALVGELVRKATDASEFAEVDLFGRPRMIDFTQYRPRGHYEGMDAQFKGSMWLSRIEFNLVSRSSRSSAPGFVPDPRETPREALDALVLADLAANAGLLDRLGAIDRDWGVLGGRREDASPSDLVGLWKKAGGGPFTARDAFDRLKAAIGNDFQRTARLHYMPQHSTVLPAISTLVGPRVFDDVSAIRLLAHSEVPDRYRVTASDLAFVFGQDRALAYLERDLDRYPNLLSQLGAARDKIGADPGTSLYGQWFAAVRALADVPKGALPSFTATAAFKDLRINSTIAAYGQVRHNYVLLSGQAYDEGGCEIPDGYVEPAPAVLDALIRYVDTAARYAGQRSSGADRWSEFGRIFRALRAIVADELAGLPPTDEQRRFLAEVAEIVPPTSDSAPEYNGWYFHLFDDTTTALEDAGFVGEYFTSSNTGEVGYLGTNGPRLGLFVVDTGGPPRVMVGPVARAFEIHAPMSRRLRDKDLAALAATAAPWEASYGVSQPAEPSLVVSPDMEASDPRSSTMIVRNARALGRVIVEQLDHHGQPCTIADVGLVNGRGRAAIRRAERASDDCYGERVRIRAGGGVYETTDFVTFPVGFGGADPYAAFH